MENLENEIWKDIPDWEGIYQASNKGRVRVLPRIRKTNNGITTFMSKMMIIQPRMKSRGYYQVNLSDRNTGRNKFINVHRLIAITFLGKRDLQVNHINGIKTDNSLENLEWLSASDNIKHAFKTGLKTAKRETYTFSKIDQIE